MKTKRKYAHELYPHPDEGEVRDLATDVPYLYAMAHGLDIHGTGAFDDATEPALLGQRMHRLIAARDLALVADALAQGLAGDEAWRWAQERAQDDTGEWMWERAEKCGVDPERIKPYPCGPEPKTHSHKDKELGNGWHTLKSVDCPESECAECCEPDEDGAS